MIQLASPRDEQAVIARLRTMGNRRLWSLGRLSHLLSLCMVMWLIILGYHAYHQWRVWDGTADRHALLVVSVTGAQLLNLGFALWGAATRGWGGYLSIWILSLAIIPVPPVGLIAAVIGVICLLGGLPLFGPNRFTHRQLEAEMRFREDWRG